MKKKSGAKCIELITINNKKKKNAQKYHRKLSYTQENNLCKKIIWLRHASYGQTILCSQNCRYDNVCVPTKRVYLSVSQSFQFAILPYSSIVSPKIIRKEYICTYVYRKKQSNRERVECCSLPGVKA